MADDDRTVLINNIYDNYGKFLANDLSVDLKEDILKDNINKNIESFINELNRTFNDVVFFHKWGFCVKGSSHNGHAIIADEYDKDHNEEQDGFKDLYEYDPYDEYFKDYFSETDLKDLELKITYFWQRRCSLKCKHSTKRFRILTMPKILELLSYYHLGKPIRSLVSDYIPDFFYNPMIEKRKPGRPKKQAHN